MKGQKFLRFQSEVTRFLTGDHTTNEEIILPLFKELSAEEEAAFRQHARDSYIVGSPIPEVFHPVWQDEARKMNDEVKK